MSARKRYRGLFIALFSLLWVLPSSVLFAGDDEITRASLRGIDGIRVMMEHVRPEIAAEGFDGGRIKSEAEQQLRAAGIKVLEDEKLPFLLICPYITKYGRNSYGSFVRVEFYQLVVPYHRLSEKLGPDASSPIDSAQFAATWTSPGVMGNAQNLLEVGVQVRNEVAKFIEAFRAANRR